MKILDIQKNDLLFKYLVITHRFIGLPNIVCSDKKIYQLPCVIGKRSYELKEIKPKYHVCRPYYTVEGKRYSDLKLKELAVLFEDNILLEEESLYPFAF